MECETESVNCDDQKKVIKSDKGQTKKKRKEKEKEVKVNRNGKLNKQRSKKVTSVKSVNTGKSEKTKESKMSQSQQLQNVNINGTKNDQEAEELPETMNVRSMMSMFKEIKKNLGDLKTTTNQKFAGAELDNSNIWDKIGNLQAEVRNHEYQNSFLAGTVVRMGKIMNEMQERIEELELEKIKCHVVITGFTYSGNKAKMVKTITSLIKREMAIGITILDIFQLNPNNDQMCIIVLQDVKEKRLLFQNKEQIKDVLNDNGQSYFFSDYLPAETNERKRREREIMKQNAKEEENEKLEMKQIRSGLLIQNEKYKKKVVPPQPEDMRK